MMKVILLTLLSSITFAQKGEMSVKDIISEIDKNMNAKSRVLTSKTSHTGDLGGRAKTSDVGDAVASEL